MELQKEKEEWWFLGLGRKKDEELFSGYGVSGR
jgi:hypothetical protein